MEHHDSGAQDAPSWGDPSRLADLIAERLAGWELERTRWVRADVVADHLSVDVSYVYEHAAQLGARRLGTGSRARLRFRLDLVDQALAPKAETANSEPRRPRRRRRAAQPETGVPLLPIRRSDEAA